MSCVGVVEVFDKVPRLFVKIHRWAFIKMSKSCKLSGLKGGNFHSKKQKEGVHAHKSGRKWKRRVLFLCLWLLVFVSIVMCIWVLLGFYDGSFRSKQESLDSCEGRAQALLQYFNVSSDQLHDLASIFSKSEQITSLECSKERINKLASADGIDCVLRVLCSKENEFQQKGRWHGQQVKHIQQKPAEDEKLSRKLKRLLLDDFLPFVAHSLLSLHDCRKCISKRTGHSVGYLLKVLPSGFAEDYLWIFLGVLLACIIFLFYMNLRKKQKQKISKVEPVLQQQQQLLQMKQQNLPLTPPKSAGKWRRIILNVFLIFGVLTSAWLYWYLRQNLTLRREEALTNMCDERARMLQDQFNVSMNHVHALALLVSTFHHGKTPSAVDQKTFGEYTERTSFERPLTSGVAYALRVPHSEREQFEKHHRWTIKKMEKEDQTLVQDCDPEKLDPAPLQDEYAPVIFSQETVSHILSIDMMSGKEDRENILRARATGKGVLTSPFKLLKSNHVGVVLTFAVYNTDLPPNATPKQRIEATVGYIGASYDVPSLVEKLLHQLAGKETIVVNVYDTTNTSSPILMYGTNIIGDADPDLLHISYLDFGDPLRKHEMHCRYKHKAPIPWTAINASAGVLVIIILVFHIFHAAISRIAKVEKDFREMMELKVRAEAADVAKSQFLATVSHEIRTPMNGVLGMLQMLMDTDLNATQIDYAQTAHNSGKDLISLINEVLDQAKIESGRLELEAVPFEVRCILDNVLSLLSGKSSEKGIELAVYVSNQVPEVVIGDPGRFRQIITNLVGNSIKFTNERGHIFVTVHLADEVQILPEVKDPVLKQSLNFVSDEPNITYSSLSGLPVVDRWKSWEKFKNLNSTDMKDGTQIIRLLVTVEDTGVGIRADAQSHIFTPFMQADSSTSRTYGGTGIGLSISRCLVELMGGEIGFVSEPGISSTFSFTCAFRKGESSSLDTKWQPCDPAVLEFQGWRVLVIDKRSIRAEVTKYHLQRLGMSVDIASSMELVYADLSSGGPACVPADLAMVIVDKDAWNAEIAASLRNLLIKHKQNCGSRLSVDVPKFFLLASTTDECCKLISAGLVDNILTKPLRSSFLISSFLEALGCDKKSQLSRKKPATLGTLLRGKQLLVVDDNAVNRKVAEGALKKYGAIVTCVDSGKAAVKMLQPPHEIDACFMDLQMPEMDGYEATKQIRSLESEFNELIASGKVTVEKYGNIAHWYTPILAMTADVSKPTNEKCIKSGMDDYVSKPFEEEKLYNAVARFFESG